MKILQKTEIQLAFQLSSISEFSFSQGSHSVLFLNLFLFSMPPPIRAKWLLRLLGGGLENILAVGTNLSKHVLCTAATQELAAFPSDGPI